MLCEKFNAMVSIIIREKFGEQSYHQGVVRNIRDIGKAVGVDSSSLTDEEVWQVFCDGYGVNWDGEEDVAQLEKELGRSQEDAGYVVLMKEAIAEKQQKPNLSTS
jgi:hypothetical protein